MTCSPERTSTVESPVYREYILDVRIVEERDGDPVRYRFEAPHHQGITFEDPDLATLYADVYFDVNGFQEEGTGERGVPPRIIAAGRDTLAAYLHTQFDDIQWLASFFGRRPGQVERYLQAVRDRGEEIRTGAKERDVA
jgi:hypothetical protein